jgi:Flp pilus assembly pilin Flp
MFEQAFEARLCAIEHEWSPPMMIFFKRLIKDASGVTAIEYGLIASLIVVGSFLALNSTSVNLRLQDTFSKVASSLH